MAFTGTNPANVGDHLQEIIAPVALGSLIDGLDFLNDITKFSESEISGSNGVYDVPVRGALTANARAPLGNVTDQALSDTKKTVTPTEFESSFVIDSQVDILMKPEAITGYVEDAAKAVAEKICIQAISDISGTGGLASSGADNVAITKSLVEGLKKDLSLNKIPRLDRFLYLSNESLVDLMGITEYQTAFAYSGLALMAETPQIAGMTVKESSYMLDGALGHVNLGFQKGQIGQLFIPQKDVSTASQVKRTMTVDGVSLSVLMESVPGTNGASRITVSVIHQAAVLRTVGVLKLLGK